MILVNNLKKSYDGHEALKGIHFSIQEGEFYGLLGPNGAGKTTTISILSTILTPDSGEVKIGGYDLKSSVHEVKKLIGVVPQEIALYNELSALENLMFWGSLYQVHSQQLEKKANELLELLGLADRKNEKIKNYSGGMKRRINIAAALLHQPKILFMDEPTVGIDPQSRNLIFEVVEKLHQEGMTIIYTTHYMEVAEKLCDRIGIIDNGQIIAEGSLEELKKSTAIQENILITFSNLDEKQLKSLSLFWPNSKIVEQTVTFYTSGLKADLAKIIAHSNHTGLDISNIEILKTNLETLFLNLTGKQLRD